MSAFCSKQHVITITSYFLTKEVYSKVTKVFVHPLSERSFDNGRAIVSFYTLKLRHEIHTHVEDCFLDCFIHGVLLRIACCYSLLVFVFIGIPAG